MARTGMKLPKLHKQIDFWLQRHLARNHRKARRHGHVPAIVAGKPGTKSRAQKG